MQYPLLLCVFWSGIAGHGITILTAGEAQVTPVVAAPGSDITLGCFFPQKETNSPLQILVSWHHMGKEVVHKYSQGSDQLQTQSSAYKGRTQLYPDQIEAGNASLRLAGVQESDHGNYTCAVMNEEGIFHEHISVLVAAPYIEPEFSVQTSCDNITVKLTSSEGFPQPTLNWSWTGEREVTHLSLDSRGRYEVQSEMVLRPNDTLTVTVEIKLEVLNQSFSRTIILHPQPKCSVKRDRRWLLAPLVVSSVVLLILAMCIRRCPTGSGIDKDSSSSSLV